MAKQLIEGSSSADDADALAHGKYANKIATQQLFILGVLGAIDCTKQSGAFQRRDRMTMTMTMAFDRRG